MDPRELLCIECIRGPVVPDFHPFCSQVCTSEYYAKYAHLSLNEEDEQDDELPPSIDLPT